MDDEITWHPQLYQFFGKSFCFFGIKSYFYPNLIKDILSRSGTNRSLYLLYGMYDILLASWFTNSELDELTWLDDVINVSGGDISPMAVEKVYRINGVDVAEDFDISVLTNYDFEYLDKIQKKPSQYSEEKLLNTYQDVIIGKKRPLKKIRGFITINQFVPNRGDTTRILDLVKDSLRDPEISGKIYGLFVGSGMCDVLIEFHVDTYHDIWLLAQAFESIPQRVRSKLTTLPVAKTISTGVAYCPFLPPSLRVIEEIWTQRYPELRECNPLEKMEFIKFCEQLKPWILAKKEYLDDFIRAFIGNKTKKGNDAVIKLGVDLEEGLRKFIKNLATKNWEQNWLQELRRRYDDKRNYEKWSFGGYVEVFSKLNKEHNWLPKESISSLAKFVEARNKPVHTGRSTKLLELKEALLDLMPVVDNLPFEF